MIIQRKHPFQSGCSKFIAILSLWTLPILWVRQDRHFLFLLVPISLIEKGKPVYINLGGYHPVMGTFRKIYFNTCQVE